MRIATSTLYSQQTQAIDDQTALYAQLGQQLSSGKKLTQPSDDPAQIAQDLILHTTIDATTQQSTNVQNAVSELTTTDGALSSLTSVIQSARQLAIQGSSDTLTQQQRGALASQIDQLLQQAITIGNTSYGGRYVFAGSAKTVNAPVQQQGNPISAVQFLGNEQTQGQLVYNGQQFALSTTFQAAFNYQSPDGSPDVFQMLINLRDTLSNGTAADTSAAAINHAGAVVYGPQGAPSSPAPTTLATPNAFAVTPVADSTGNYSITIDGSVNGVPGTSTITVPAATAIDDGTATSLVGRINAVSATTGVTAAFNAKTQKVVLTGQGSFSVADASSPGATNTGNLTKVLNLAPQADFVQNLSTQLGDIDNVLNGVLNARSVVGARIQALGAIQSQLQTDLTDNKNSESGIEDVDVASAVTQLSQTQTALQAAYSTTNKLESKTLFDYLT
ncbi:MAG TPA: flagellar hook-associated protein FlgL [Candidatus Elarobacter sp.]|jgi:flagellar hook-associated protein 3 FlgL|nr:flagellar hook-associated protein FlgL [Candidatus Elarobacter sp.]